MPQNPDSFKLGPGTLNIGETGTATDFAAQVTEITVKWDSDSEDDVPVLSGGMLAGDDTFTATLEVTFIQSIKASGIVDYTWKNRGKVFPVTFEPSTGTAKVTGNIKIMPLDLGGEVKKTNTSDVEFPFVGEPDFYPEASEPIEGSTV